MTNVFQPNVFQPDVFQVGTLDVVIPDVVTKHHKWLSISVPGAGQSSGVSAFAVSRDSAGILLGVRDNAAPQFAVSRDAEGLLLSAWPSKPPLPTAYVASGYVLGTGAPGGFRLQMFYWNAAWQTLGATAPAQITTSLTDWQRVYVTAPVVANLARVSVQISCPKWSPQGAYWTAIQMDGGAVPGAYEVGGANLILNPEFATGLSYWSTWFQPGWPSDPLNAGVFSRAASLPSSPPPGITTALKYQSDGYDPGAGYTATYNIALPTP